MPSTVHYNLHYIGAGESARNLRADLQANAETTDAALNGVQAYVNQLATILPAGQTVIGLDIDGRPYFDPAGSVSNPVGLGLDTDGRPYYVEWTP